MNEEPPSKTRRKQQMAELQELGAALVELPQTQLATLDLPPQLASAVQAARRITAHEGKRRQMQFIGRLMRDVDAEPIRAHLAALHGGSAQTAALHRRLEKWRLRLVEDDAALTEFAQEHPRADLQVLRAAIRNARREQKEGGAPHAFRELFRLVRAAAAESAAATGGPGQGGT